ncbi:trypco2 family protein [Nocardia alni]|uniref:trypco2 family protein n=1 Tax=Nocardia alni TaxID=2815723 RepID=UPI0027E144C6|nr:trypco2 family protein [Nocardia alni]
MHFAAVVVPFPGAACEDRVASRLLCSSGIRRNDGVSMEIELADAVAAVREELLHAAARGIGQPVEFLVGPIELEFAVELRRDAKAKAGFKAWVVTGDVEGGLSRGRTHRVSVTLTPERLGGGGWLVSGDKTRPEGPGDLSHTIRP